jgi:hypothetical protein
MFSNLFTACFRASSFPSALSLLLVASLCAVTIALFLAYVVRAHLGYTVPRDRVVWAVLAGIVGVCVLGTVYLYEASSAGAISMTVCLPQRLTAAAGALAAAAAVIAGAIGVAGFIGLRSKARD